MLKWRGEKITKCMALYKVKAQCRPLPANQQCLEVSQLKRENQHNKVSTHILSLKLFCFRSQTHIIARWRKQFTKVWADNNRQRRNCNQQSLLERKLVWVVLLSKEAHWKVVKSSPKFREPSQICLPGQGQRFTRITNQSRKDSCFQWRNVLVLCLKSGCSRLSLIKRIAPLLVKEPHWASLLCCLLYLPILKVWRPYIINWLLQLFWWCPSKISFRWFLA